MWVILGHFSNGRQTRGTAGMDHHHGRKLASAAPSTGHHFDTSTDLAFPFWRWCRRWIWIRVGVMPRKKPTAVCQVSKVPLSATSPPRCVFEPRRV
jgi:hypothetical protein